MIHVFIPGLQKSVSKETRYGDGQIINDGTNYIVIDGFCGKGSTILINTLKEWGVKSPILALSHPHVDHMQGLSIIMKDKYFTPKEFWCYDPATLSSGLSNNKGSAAVRDDISDLNTIINLAKSKNIPVKFLKHNQSLTRGDIKIKIYRQQPSKVANDDNNGWAYVNDGSLCFFFPEIGYWTSGDGPERIYNLAKSVGAKVKFFKIPHHGNNCPESQSKGLKKIGVIGCWYNDLEPNGIGTTGFTAYGARRCKQIGLSVFTTFTDINMICYNGKVHIWHGAKEILTYTASYEGPSNLKLVSVDVVRDIFIGKYFNGDTRITKLIRAGYYPKTASEKVSLVIETAKDIIDGKVNYGKNEERINKLDAEFGKGFGLLIQDEINSLLKAKSRKW